MQNDQIEKDKSNINDPRKHPAPGYDEEKPTKKKIETPVKVDIRDRPEDQNTG